MVSPIYAAIAALVLIGLSVHVIRGRRKFGVALGDANELEMQRRTRAQANLIEYAPLCLLLLAFAEHGGLAVWALHCLGMLFIAGRCMHAWSVLRAEQYEQGRLITNPIWRIRGMAITFGVLGVLAVINLWQSL